MGGPYQIPRNVKGEGRILYIFSTKGLIFTGVAIFIGLMFFFLFRAIGLSTVAWIILILFALIGFVIGTFKMPDTNAFEITRKTGGENIDDILLRWIKFKMKGKQIYTIMKEEGTKDDNR